MGEFGKASVIIDLASKDDEDNMADPIQYENVELLVLDGEQLHVWVDGTHYTGAGTADTVNEGDMFYVEGPEMSVWKVIEIDESSESDVRFEIVYPSGSPETDMTHQSILTGLSPQDQPMGYLGPPTLLKETSL